MTDSIELHEEQERRKAMEGFRDAYDDMPDSAFFQLAKDMHRWTAADWTWFGKLEAERQGKGEK